MDFYGGGTGFDATDMDAPSSQLIAFVNLDSHSHGALMMTITFPSLTVHPFPLVVLSVFSFIWGHIALLLTIVCYAVCHRCRVQPGCGLEGVIGVYSFANYVYCHRSSEPP